METARYHIVTILAADNEGASQQSSSNPTGKKTK